MSSVHPAERPASATPSRRERLRLETVDEIVRVARRIVVEHGADGLSLRPIAREMGMTAPALYRYFPGREALMDRVVADIYDELTHEVRAARDTVHDPVDQLMVVARRFRQWALEHPREFGLVFATPISFFPPEDGSETDPSYEAGMRFAAVFAESLVALYVERPFAILADDEIEPALRRELLAWQRQFPYELPLGALLVFLTGWIRIYGIVCMEVFGHLRFALADAGPMFEHEGQGLARLLRTPASATA
jgi:AcrR family transcriptional regulator